MPFPILPPIEPMLAKLTDRLPKQEGFLFEPKWDGFRAVVFRDGRELYIQSRDKKPLDRYFPELHASLLASLPKHSVVDGEIVIATSQGLDFDALQLRLLPAESRVAKLARETPASFVAFDLLAMNGRSIMRLPQAERRALLERLLATARPPLHLTPMTRDYDVAARWLRQFEGAGLDGVVAKDADLPYTPRKHAMLKIKHVRTADCIVAGFRWYKGTYDGVGSLLLGLYDQSGILHHVGVTSAFTTEIRQERVCEVKYDHMQGDRFRHAAQFLRCVPTEHRAIAATTSSRSRRRSSLCGSSIRRRALTPRGRVGANVRRSDSRSGHGKLAYCAHPVFDVVSVDHFAVLDRMDVDRHDPEALAAARDAHEGSGRRT